MGQASSKKRQKTSGKSGSKNSDTWPRGKCEDLNGSIEVDPDKDGSFNVERRHSNPISPTSPTSVGSLSPSRTPEKKEKRKRFRVGFSLKRTPSGRWSRKKKTPTQNGSRPVSCPESLKEEQIFSPGRPQSLFLDDVQIQEDDNKIETVDLSDNEDGKAAAAEDDKTVSKRIDKTKWRRGSNKTSSGKKKKRDKETSKKDKKKKSKNSGKANTANAPEATSHICVVSSKPTQKTPESKGLCADKGNTTITELPQPDIDIDKIASDIVAQTIKIAQERLRAESCNGISNAPLVQDRNDLANTEINTTKLGKDVCEQAKFPFLDVSGSTQQLPCGKLEMADSVASAAEDIIAETVTGADDTANKSLEITESRPELIESAMFDKTGSDNAEVLDQDTNVEAEAKVGNCKLIQNSQCCLEESIEIQSHTTENKFSVDEIIGNITDKQSEEYMTEMIAKRTVEKVIASALEFMHKEDFKGISEHNVVDKINTDDAEILKLKNVTDESKCDQENKDKDDTEEKKIVQTVENENAQQAEGEIDKEKPKSEMKMKVQKKLSHWFHKKEKPSKRGNKMENQESHVKDTSLHCDAAGCIKSNKDSSKDRVMDSETLKIDSMSSELPTADRPHNPNASLALHTNLSSSAGVSSPTEHSPFSDEATSPSASVSPTTSNSSDEAPLSLSDDQQANSGILKKISLGSRLRTAILRKKSSDGSEDGQDKQTFPLTPPKLIDSSDVTPLKPVDSSALTHPTHDDSSVPTPVNHVKNTLIPQEQVDSIALIPPKRVDSSVLSHSKSVDSNILIPPLRKYHNKKSAQTSPDTSELQHIQVSCGSSLQSPTKLIESVVGHTTELGNSVNIDDNGFADLTSPESNKSDISYNDPDDCHLRENVEEATTVLVSVRENLDKTTPLDFAQKNLDETSFISGLGSLMETAGNRGFCNWQSESTAAVFDPVHGQSESTAVFDHAHEQAESSASVLDPAHEQLEGTAAVFDAASGNLEPASVVLDSNLEQSNVLFAVLDSAYGHPESKEAVLDSAHVDSEAASTVFDIDQGRLEVVSCVLDSALQQLEETSAMIDPALGRPETATDVFDSAKVHPKVTTTVFKSAQMQSEVKTSVLDFSRGKIDNLSTDPPTNNKGKSHQDTIDYEDDTRPTTQNFDDVDYSVSRVYSKSMDYFSPLESANLVSTAVIILRPPSNEGQIETANKSLTIQAYSNSEIQSVLESRFQEKEIRNELSESLFSTPDSHSIKTSEIKEAPLFQPSFIHHEALVDGYEKQPNPQKTVLNETVLNLEQKEVLKNRLENHCKQNETDYVLHESETFSRKDRSMVRTIAEYKIGLASDYQERIHERLPTECHFGNDSETETVSSTEDNKTVTADIPWSHAEEHNLRERLMENYSHYREFHAFSSDAPQANQQHNIKPEHQEQSAKEKEEEEGANKTQEWAFSNEALYLNTTNTPTAKSETVPDASTPNIAGFPETAVGYGQYVTDTKSLLKSTDSDAASEETGVSGNSCSNKLQGNSARGGSTELSHGDSSEA